jgi:Xaa-Pro dipeptidase
VELAGQLEFHARTLGHQGAVRMRGFNQELYFGHIMSGDNAAAISFFDGPTGGSGLNPSYPQGAGKEIIRANEPILVDFVSVLGGYMVDQTRIYSIGEPPAYLLEAYNQAVKIKKSLAAAGKPGVRGSLLFEQAEQMAREAGLANHFMGYTEKVSFVGHGVGIELDELPVIARGLDTLLEEGMVFALEPKFIFPGEGTVGIEDTFVVGKDNLKQITGFSDQLQII